MNQVPTKIVLKSTTRMSLNDRFSTIVPNVQSIRSNMAAENQVSSANRRLAQQLANRPGIPQNQVNNMMMYNNHNQNMMNMNNMNNNNNNQMMRGGRGGRRGGGPLQNRVGKGNVKARLSLPPTRGRGRGARGGNQNFNNNNNNNAVMTSPFNNKPTRGRGVIASRTPRGRGGFRGGRGGQQLQQQQQQQFNRDDANAFNARFPARDNSRYRGSRPPTSRGKFQNSDRFTGQSTVRGGVRGGRGGAVMQRGGGARGRGGAFNNRGGRGFSRGGRGAARGRGRGNAGGGKASMEELDSQLDLYMAKTKSSLDSELDAYMAQVSTD